MSHRTHLFSILFLGLTTMTIGCAKSENSSPAVDTTSQKVQSNKECPQVSGTFSLDMGGVSAMPFFVDLSIDNKTMTYKTAAGPGKDVLLDGQPHESGADPETAFTDTAACADGILSLKREPTNPDEDTLFETTVVANKHGDLKRVSRTGLEEKTIYFRKVFTSIAREQHDSKKCPNLVGQFKRGGAGDPINLKTSPVADGISLTGFPGIIDAIVIDGQIHSAQADGFFYKAKCVDGKVLFENAYDAQKSIGLETGNVVISEKYRRMQRSTSIYEPVKEAVTAPVTTP